MQKVVSASLVLMLLCTVTAYPLRAYAVTEPMQTPEISSEAAVLMDASNGQILFQKNMDQKKYPASITKIMTGMLALEKGNLSDNLTMSYGSVFSIDRGSSHIALDVGEEITLGQALYAMSTASANDAANGIAEFIGGTMENFVKMMNEAAVKAGAKNTNFVNAHGLYDDNHYTTAYDMAKITAAALRVPGFTEIFSSASYDIPPTNKQPETRLLRNSNKLLNGEIPYDGIVMSKAGWTNETQHTLVTAAQRGGTTLIVVVMKSPNASDKWEETVALLDYGFEQFTRTSITEELTQSAPNEVTVPNNTLISTAFTTPGDISLLLPVGMTVNDVSITYGTPEVDTTENQVELPACISLSESLAPSIPTEIMDITMRSPINSAESTAVPASVGKLGEETVTQDSKNKGKWLLWFLLLPFSIFVIFIGLVLRRRYIIKRRRRRRRRN